MLGNPEFIKQAAPGGESSMCPPASMGNELAKNRSETNKRTILKQEIDDSISHVMKLREHRHKSLSRNEALLCAHAYLTGSGGGGSSSELPMRSYLGPLSICNTRSSESKKQKKSVSRHSSADDSPQRVKFASAATNLRPKLAKHDEVIATAT